MTAEAGEEQTWNACIESLGHDLNSLTLLESREEFEAYMAKGLAGGHNRALDSTRQAAERLGWVDDDEDED